MIKRGTIFLYSEFIDPDFIKNSGLELQFLSFGYIEAKLYRYYNSEYVAVGINQIKRNYGNNKVFGALFFVNNYKERIRTLDSLHSCSLDALGQHLPQDVTIRTIVEFHPISFKSLEHLAFLIYDVQEPLLTETYMGNVENELVQSRVLKREHRILDGVHAVPFYKLYKATNEGGI